MTAGDPVPGLHSTPSGDGPPAAPHPLELALRHGLRYSGLRDVAVDPRMLLYIPLETCEREMVLALSVADNALEVATAYHDPDLTLIAERFPALSVELVLAPVDRIAELQDELRVAL